MKASYDHYPPTFEQIAPGQHYFNYDVEPVLDEDEHTIGYECNQVLIMGKLNYGAVVRAVIRAKYDESEEFDLVNEFNGFQMGVPGINGLAVARYRDFINDVRQIKQMVQQMNLKFNK